MNHFRDLLFMTSGFSLLNSEILVLALCKHLTRGVKIERPSSEACKSSCGYGLFFPLWCTASSISLELTTLFQSSSLSAMYRLSLQWALQSHYGQSLLTYSIKSQTIGKKFCSVGQTIVQTRIPTCGEINQGIPTSQFSKATNIQAVHVTCKRNDSTRMFFQDVLGKIIT